ncbi:MAG: hypothetical protein UZ07_CHB004001870 [Chlorobi bacterium OLB7]|nr:MAG: hypothetical protein UZ07_CHB004001870 [Chlorobi bacterium OLB7]
MDLYTMATQRVNSVSPIGINSVYDWRVPGMGKCDGHEFAI